MIERAFPIRNSKKRSFVRYICILCSNTFSSTYSFCFFLLSNVHFRKEILKKRSFLRYICIRCSGTFYFRYSGGGRVFHPNRQNVEKQCQRVAALPAYLVRQNRAPPKKLLPIKQLCVCNKIPTDSDVLCAHGR